MAHRLPWRADAIRDWPIWSLPRWLSVYVIMVVAAYLAAIGVAAPAAVYSEHDLALFGLLLGCTVAAVEMTRKAGEHGGVMKDVQGVWELPVAILLSPFYALVIPIAQMALIQWRVRHGPLHRRVFTAAAVGLSYGAASVTFHSLSGLAAPHAGGTLSHDTLWTLLVLLSACVKWTLNKALVITAVKGANRAANVRTAFFGGEPLYNDAAEICIGVLVTFGVAGDPLLALAALPVVTLLQRSLSHVQLVSESRTDSKTGLLNAATWDREATAEVVRAVRTRSPLAVALLDIDKFKVINDTYGHLVGDEVLKEVANALNSLLRDYDLAGRFGGEEFSVLLPQTRAVDALRIAERVRTNIAGLSIIAPGATGAERVHVTVSIGVAALESGSHRELAELMAAADAALYRAKADGRDQVQMTSPTADANAATDPGRAAADPGRAVVTDPGSGAGSPGTAAAARGANRSSQDAPGARRRAQSS